MKPLKPPASRLPVGASDWATVEDVAIALRRDVRTVKHWCANRLVLFEDLAGGVGGRWIAVADGCWPLSDPAGVAAYRSRRTAIARANGAKGSAAALAARKNKADAKSRRRTSTPRRSA